jgi:CRISPR system Cascade subunit CasE
VYLSKASFRPGTSLDSIAPILFPENGNRAGASHRMVWSLFTDGTPQTRVEVPFLFREEKERSFIIVSDTEPTENAFLSVQSKCLDDVTFRKGQKLAFTLRANAMVSVGKPDGKGRTRRESVLTRLHRENPNASPEDEQDAVAAWLRRVGDGIFVLNGMVLVGEMRGPMEYKYQRRELHIVEIEGVLTVADPQRFKEKLLSGYGRAKAFGCGLMMVKKV